MRGPKKIDVNNDSYGYEKNCEQLRRHEESKQTLWENPGSQLTPSIRFLLWVQYIDTSLFHFEGQKTYCKILLVSAAILFDHGHHHTYLELPKMANSMLTAPNRLSISSSLPMIDIARAKPAYFGNGMRGTALQRSSVSRYLDPALQLMERE